jgi:hypothetical protein
MRKYKKWYRHYFCEPYLGEVMESSMPEWEELLPYEGQWVGIVDRHVVASGTPEEVYAQAPGCLLYSVPKSGAIYVLNVH